MKTKPSESVSTAFPTCGEVFHYLITALDLTAWADAFHDPKSNTKRREQSEIKNLSDKLRDWATETEGRAPSREELEQFIRDQLHGLPREKELGFVLCSLWIRVLDEHAGEVRENSTYLDREGTRAWCARWRAPSTLYFLWALQKLLRRLAQSTGPMLDSPLDDLLAKSWPDTTTAENAHEHPLHSACYKHYADLRIEDFAPVDAKTVAAWKSGEDRPSCDALGRHFAQSHDKLGLLLNFAFAGLLEALANTLRASVSNEDWPDCRRLLLGQARCVHDLDAAVTKELERMPGMSLPDYEDILSGCLGDYMEFLMRLPRGGLDALDLRVARFRVYEEYQQLFLETQKPPRNFGEFCGRLDTLWKETALKSPSLRSSAVDAQLAKLRTEYPEWSGALAGPLLAIKARMALCHEPPTAESIQRALSLYQKAFAESRYRAGVFTTRVAHEALGLAALLHRHETGEGAIKPWIKKVLVWWDLLQLGKEFNHELLDQRIELAESGFTDGLNMQLRARLKAALPQLGLNHFNIGGMFGFADEGLIEKLKATPVDRRQKKPMSNTIVGRDQTALMEAIDRDKLDLARELVRKGADLNFINSTGDTCVTKAFARKAYDLVLELLRRDHEPIRRETVLRVTNKMRISGLEQTLSHGQAEILRELAEPKPGRREDIDMNTERLWEQTPLYYAVSLLVHYRMNAEEAFTFASKLVPGRVATALTPEAFKAAHKHLAREYNSAGVIECIKYLINDLRVDLDTPNTGDNSALTYAVERRLHDVAAMLLAAGANVNHRFQGSGTALVRAILNDDCEMARLLLEYRADYRLFIDPPLGRPIYAMPMSEKMRRLIPHRL